MNNFPLRSCDTGFCIIDTGEAARQEYRVVADINEGTNEEHYMCSALSPHALTFYTKKGADAFLANIIAGHRPHSVYIGILIQAKRLAVRSFTTSFTINFGE